ncbi:MAG: hypothetical protein ACRD5H_02380 [Nitrososphaerales archaeon]
MEKYTVTMLRFALSIADAGKVIDHYNGCLGKSPGFVPFYGDNQEYTYLFPMLLNIIDVPYFGRGKTAVLAPS